MAPRPGDVYDPTPNVMPSTGMPNDYNSVRATSNAFGAQEGAATERGAATIQQGEASLINTATQYQGMINETLATSADSALQVKQGEILSKYKSLEGLQAFAAHDQAVKDIQTSREEFRSQLPNMAAQRAFDMLTLRTTGYAIRDIGDHAATQIKQAHTNSASAGRDLAISNASMPEVAMDDNRFKDNLDSVKFFTQQMIQNQGYIAPGVSVSGQVDENGDPVFLDTEQGHMAKAVYEDQMKKATSAIWENRAETIANDLSHGGSPLKAMDMVNQNRDKIPPDAYAKIVSSLRGSVKGSQLADIGDAVIGNVKHAYDNGGYSPTSDDRNHEISSSVSGLGLGLVETSGSRSVEKNKAVHGVSNSLHIPDQEGISHAQDYDFPANPGENPAQHLVRLEAAAEEIREHYKDDPSVKVIVHQPGDPHSTKPSIHIQWPPGAADKTFLGKDFDNSQWTSFADYAAGNLDKIYEAGRQEGIRRGLTDPSEIDAAGQTARNRALMLVKDETARARQYGNIVSDEIHSGKFSGGVPPTSRDQLDKISDPQFRAAWTYYNTNYSYAGAVKNFDAMLQSNVHNQKVGYGSDFYDNYMKAADGHIQNPAQDMQVGPGLTDTGYHYINNLLGQRTNPDDHVFWKEESVLIKKLHDEYTGAQQFPGFRDPAIEEKFGAKMVNVLNYIQQHRKDMTPEQLLNSTINGKPNPDWAGKFYAQPTANEQAELFAKGLSYMRMRANFTQAAAQTFKTPQDLQDYIIKNKITDHDMIKKLIIKNGFAKEPPKTGDRHADAIGLPQ